METFFKSVPHESIEQERIKGFRISVYFRFVLVGLVLTANLVQLSKGYRAEALFSLIPILSYLFINTGLWLAVRRNLYRNSFGYMAATVDVLLIAFHLFYSTAFFDYSSATAAASIFLFPIFFLLYTFLINRNLLIYLIFLSLMAFNTVYFIHYFQQADLYNQLLSLSPLSHSFKTLYMLFAGFLCLYLQHSISIFLEKSLTEAASKVQLDAKIRIEEEKNRHALELIEQEMLLSKYLELEVREKERLADELKENKEQLQSILSNLVGAASRCLFDENITVIYYTERILDITGYPASDFVNNAVRSFASIIHPDDIAHCNDKILEAHKNKTPYEFEYRIIHKNGHIVWIKENGNCIYDEYENIKFLDGISIDITARKNAELAAQESQRNYKELMDFLPQPVFELNMQGQVILSNKAGDEFFGPLPTEPGIAQSALDCFIEEDRPRIIESFKKSAMGLSTEPGEFTAIKKDGSLCPVMVFGNPIVRNGEIVGRRGIIIDISERKKQEISLLMAKEELEQINNSLEQRIAERTDQLTKANTQLLKLQKENLQSQFEVLKQQVNPHFLFNSLNVLTSLIKIDPDLAESFTERLSKVYRYVLENKEKDVVSLSTELEFLHSYLFLLEIRFMKKIIVNINIPRVYYEYEVLPIAIQLIIENAIKHNTFSKADPLKIEIFVDENETLNIINNLNIRENKMVSTGVGLENIRRRYALVSDKEPIFSKTETHFVAQLPLLKE